MNGQEHKQRQFTKAGHERQHVAGNDARFLDWDDDAAHALDPGDVQDHSALFQFSGYLKHRVQRTAAGERDILDRADDDQQRVGVEQVDILVREQHEERCADRNRRHQIGEEGDCIYVSR